MRRCARRGLARYSTPSRPAFPTRMASPLRRRRSPVRTATTSRCTSVARRRRSAAGGGAPSRWRHGHRQRGRRDVLANSGVPGGYRPRRRRRRIPQLRGKAWPAYVSGRIERLRVGLRWVAAHRAELGVSHLIVCGESGGGNLTLTVGHKAKREGWLPEIAGFYAQCPYISNRWHEVPDGLPSLRECDGYFINLQQAELLGSIYDPDGAALERRHVFRRFATDDDLSGLPPHVISVNELDPMRDEAWTTTGVWCVRACRLWAEWSRVRVTAVTCCWRA